MKTIQRENLAAQQTIFLRRIHDPICQWVISYIIVVQNSHMWGFVVVISQRRRNGGSWSDGWYQSRKRAGEQALPGLGAGIQVKATSRGQIDGC
jgi:hypothetical protein